MVAFIDYRTTTIEKKSLSKLNIDFIEVPKNSTLYDAIDGHVDIQLNIIINQTTDTGEEPVVPVLICQTTHQKKLLCSTTYLGMSSENI